MRIKTDFLTTVQHWPFKIQ